MRVYFMFSRSYILVLCILMLVCFTLLGMTTQNKACINLETEKERCAFLEKYGVKNATLIECKDIYIPYEFDEQFELYSETLIKGGYDLSQYKGKEVAFFRYDDGNGYYNIYICEGNLIGADRYQFGEKYTDVLMKE